ncbi:lipopolysaccharide biosynthesis protein [Pontibacter akesuensis]|uniref:Membrane protein involved in the export of O-antigen and teichoic acid n=1 Tax=Pontibacter akesuensis TaxID=388950 RepID=A0A1I7J220_9BACT|nr:lipopolysaccharide biosynthesis protein [Pontibacter akesuensis]GHA72891.1 lipopolysaccharide biosynthesis protein [Pontibacter akesuensis]SFU79200.1 Membrane protein involved in the export of O-antigen and teichoic acid [Pontibacter akesuensis]
MAVASIKKNIASGIKWNTISVIGTRSTDFVVKLILARLLLPEAYGIIGMAMIIINFLQVISDMGLFNALVQKKEDALTETRYSSAFWFLLAIGTGFIALFFTVISPFGASFYQEPRLVPILNALSLYLFFNILTIIPRVILTKKLAFKTLVTIRFSGSVVSSIVAITLAFSGFGVWSLVMKYLLGSGIIFISYWARVGWKPRFTFQGSSLRQLAGYSTYTQVNGILFFFRNNVDYLIIGKLVSAHMLGVYTLAFTLSEALRGQLYSIFNKVLFPVYSKMQDDLPMIREYYLKIMTLTATVTFPVSVLFIGLSPDIILVLFGEEWVEAAAPLRILSVASMIFAISGTPAEVLKSIGKPSVSFYLNITNTFLVALPGIYFGLKYFGLTGVAYAVCLHYTTSRITFHYFMKKYIHVSDKDVFAALSKPVLGAAMMLFIILLITRIGMPPLPNMIIAGAAGGLAYGLLFARDLKQGVKLLKKS